MLRSPLGQTLPYLTWIFLVARSVAVDVSDRAGMFAAVDGLPNEFAEVLSSFVILLSRWGGSIFF